jgi:hypothetical protein
LSGGLVAVVAGAVSTSLCFFLIPLLKGLMKKNEQ